MLEMILLVVGAALAWLILSHGRARQAVPGFLVLFLIGALMLGSVGQPSDTARYLLCAAVGLILGAGGRVVREIVQTAQIQ